VVRVGVGAWGARGTPGPHLRAGGWGGRRDAYSGPGARKGSRRGGTTF
jgi:hypothetical protein